MATEDDREGVGASMMLRRSLPALGLFVLSPLVAEFLLGNMSIDAIVVLLFIAPLYGGGAILIRETTRHTGRGWPTMILLGVAYAVFLEGVVNQTLFNPSYLGHELLNTAYIPALGMSAWWTLYVLTLHTVWSTSVSIALVEALVPERRTAPWLGTIGLTVVGVLFVLGTSGVFYSTYQQTHFLASPPQLIGTTVAIVALIVGAVTIGRRPRPHAEGPVPNPWVVGVVSLTASSLFMAVGLFIADIPDWGAVGGYLVLYAVVIGLVSRWSRREGWGTVHRLALAGGALLTYAWHAFPLTPIIGTTGTIDVIGNVVFALGAVVLLAAAVFIQYRSRNAERSVRSVVSGDN